MCAPAFSSVCRPGYQKTEAGAGAWLAPGLVSLTAPASKLYNDLAMKVYLESLGYKNVDVRLAGETLGWPEEAPYDAIMVTAGAPHVPESLLAQLAIGGRMVIPVGSRYLQELCKVTRQKRKNVVQNLGGCRFVSLVGQDAWRVEDEEGKFPQQD